jgi:hypothetical protein
MLDNSSNILEEGKNYNFKVLKSISLYNNEKFFVLEAPSKNKYLLNSSMYRHYNILKNTIIKCKVDKINCNGKIFLEPEHPYLKEGSNYVFNVDTVEELLCNNKEQVLMVIDDKGITHTAILNKHFKLKKIPKHIAAKINRISKARLYLEVAN